MVGIVMNRPFILASICLPLLGCSYFPESTFYLAQESRLPKWFSLPQGMSRPEVTVRLDYYSWPSGLAAKLTLLDVGKKRTLAEVKGTTRGSEPLKLKNQRPNFPPGYPVYEIVTAKGITEILEHHRGPVFYVTDDPAVWTELGVSLTMP